MTNSFPQNPPPSPEEERLSQQIRQRVRQETSDEWIAIIVAFGTIGAILFWSLGLRKNNPLTSQLNQPAIDSAAIVEEFLNLDREDIAISEGNIETVEIEPELFERDNFSLSLNNELYTAEEDLGETNYLFGAAPFLGVAPPTVVEPEIEVEAEPEAVVVEPEVAEPEVIEPEPEVAEPEIEAEPEAVVAFNDVAEAHWAYPFLQRLGNQNLLAATSNNRFEPDDLITRAGMATLLSQAFDQPKTLSTRDFVDIDDGNIIAEDIDKSVRMGFMKGYSRDEFRPAENIPRYQVLVALATGLGLEPSGDPVATLQNFGDRDSIPDWAISQVAAATEAGLVVNRPGFDLQSLRPEQSATRAEVAAMIYQALNQLGKVENIDSNYIVPKP